ncbi:hypothetical protein ACJJTC_011536 [Scirpophaga incertulas]
MRVMRQPSKRNTRKQLTRPAQGPEYTHTRTDTPYGVTRKNRFSILLRSPAQVYSHTHSGLPAQLRRWLREKMSARRHHPNVPSRFASDQNKEARDQKTQPHNKTAPPKPPRRAEMNIENIELYQMETCSRTSNFPEFNQQSSTTFLLHSFRCGQDTFSRQSIGLVSLLDRQWENHLLGTLHDVLNPFTFPFPTIALGLLAMIDIMSDSPDIIFSQYAQGFPTPSLSWHNPEQQEPAQKKSRVRRECLKRKSPELPTCQSYGINNEKKIGLRLIQIKLLDISGQAPAGDNEETIVISAQYVVSESVDNVMEETIVN